MHDNASSCNLKPRSQACSVSVTEKVAGLGTRLNLHHVSPTCTHLRSSTVKEHSWEKARVVLVGNKCDLKDSRVVQAKQGLELAESLGVEYVETSAKDDVNVKEAFEILVDSISEKMAESTENPNLGPRAMRARNFLSVQNEREKESATGCAC